MHKLIAFFVVLSNYSAMVQGLGISMQHITASTLRAAMLVVIFGTVAQAQPATVPRQLEVTPSIPQTVRLLAGTAIELEFVETLNSKTSVTGQTFALRLRQPVTIGEQIVVAAGAMGGGEVIDAARAGMGGRSGKLILSGRYLQVQGQRVRVRGLQSVLAGQDRSRIAVNTALLIPYVGFLGGFIQGGDIEVTSGTHARAFLANDLVLNVPSQSSAPPTSPVSTAQTSTPEAKGTP